MNSKPNISAYLLRIAATYGVIVIHASAQVMLRVKHLNPDSFLFGNIYNSLFRWAVPIFIMLSGAFVLGRQESAGKFYKKRLLPLAYVLAIWSAIYGLFSFWTNTNFSFLGWIKLFALGQPYFHLYFLFIIIGLYAITPPLNMLIEKWSAKYLYMFCFALLFISMFITGYYTLKNTTPLPATSATYFLPYIAYYLAGHLLMQIKLSRRKTIFLLVMSAISGIATIFLVNMYGRLVYFYDYLGVTVVIMSITIFTAAQQFETYLKSRITEKTGQKIIYIAKKSLGIYLLHPIILKIFESKLLGISIHANVIHPAFGIPLFAGVLFLISLMFVHVFSKLFQKT